MLLADIGTMTLLNTLVGTSLLGALVTWWFGIETAGISLDDVGSDTEEPVSGKKALEFGAGYRQDSRRPHLDVRCHYDVEKVVGRKKLRDPANSEKTKTPLRKTAAAFF